MAFSYRRPVIALLIFAGFLIINSLIHDYHNKQKQKAVIAYLKSPQFIQDFKQDGYRSEELLMYYPKISRYITYTEDKNKEFSEIRIQDAEAEKCDFIYQLFKKMHAKTSDKPAILAALKQQHIQLENIYRNQYAEVLYSTQINDMERDCAAWFNQTAPEKVE